MHICFAFYHICGPFLVPDEIELKIIVVGRYHEDLDAVMGPQFFVYLYGYVMGQYGHIYPEEIYHLYIQHVIEQLSEVQEVQVVNLVPNSTLNAIPYPIEGDVANENGIAVDEE